MAEIIPAILTDSPDKFKELVRRLEPYTKRIHVDIADGELVPSKTIIGYDEIKALEVALKFDIHLMVNDPAILIKEWLFTQADRFIMHIESNGDIAAIIDELHNEGRKAGISLNPDTDLEKIENFIKKADFIQFMTVNPGFQGSKFVPDVVDKIASFHAKYPDIIIMSDGGVTPETAPSLVRAGVSQLVVGSYVIKSENFEESIEKIKSCTTL